VVKLPGILILCFVIIRYYRILPPFLSNLNFSTFFSYDFGFVDADKRMYEEYFELLLKLVRFDICFIVWVMETHAIILSIFPCRRKRLPVEAFLH
jgi:hypothetical protein